MSEFLYPTWSNGLDFDGLSSCNLDGPTDFVSGSGAQDNSQWDFGNSPWDYENAKNLAEKLLSLDVNAGQIDPETNDEQSCMKDGPSNPRFKTEYCRNYREKGTCLYGDLCQFAHGRIELRQQDVVRHSKYKTKLCQKFWIAGYCAYGPRCNFIHQEGDTEEPPRGFRPFMGPKTTKRKSSESSWESGSDGLGSQYSTPPNTGAVWQAEKDPFREYTGSAWKNMPPQTWTNTNTNDVVSRGEESSNNPWLDNRDANNPWLDNRDANNSWLDSTLKSSISPPWKGEKTVSRRPSYGSELLMLHNKTVGGAVGEIPHPEYNPIQTWHQDLNNLNSTKPESIKWRPLPC